MSQVLLSPLGRAAGAVSGVYFALREQQEISIDKIITIGTRHDDVLTATSVLKALFESEGVTYEPHFVTARQLRRGDSVPFAHRLGTYIEREYQEQNSTHVAVTGGRSGMGALAALAAQFYGAHALWHLWVDEKTESEGIEGAIRGNWDHTNPYLNPTQHPAECEVVDLPFENLRPLYPFISAYIQHERLPDDGIKRQLLAGVGVERLRTLFPPGLAVRHVDDILAAVQEWGRLWDLEQKREGSPDERQRWARRRKEFRRRVIFILQDAELLNEESLRQVERLFEERQEISQWLRVLDKVPDDPLDFWMRAKRKWEQAEAGIRANKATLLPWILSAIKDVGLEVLKYKLSQMGGTH